MNFSELHKKPMWLLIPAVAIVLLVLYFWVLQGKPEPTSATQLELITAESPQQTIPKETEISEAPLPTMIDVKGQVVKPGVYELPAGSRVQDAIEAAGGFTSEADSRSINLALIVIDESSLYVPATGEEQVVALSPQTSSVSGESVININQATETELMELPGIGPSKAAAIVAYRDEVGRFQSTEELTEVTGIGDKTFEQLKELITAK